MTRENEELSAERDQIAARYREIYRGIHTWGLTIGRWHWTRVVGNSGISIIFAVWHLAAFCAGAIITIFWDSGKELGVALVVGALFGVGSFLSQMWSQGMDRNREFIQKIELESDLLEMRDLIKRYRDIEVALSMQRADGDTRLN